MAHTDSAGELATAPIGRLLLRFGIPSILAQVVNLLYNVVDRIFVGRIPEVGPLALAGLGVAFPVILIISAFSFLAGMGGAPLASIAMGRGDNEKAERILGASCVFLLVMSVVLAGLCFLIMRPALLLFGASEQTIGYAMDYFSLYLLGTPAVQLTLGLNYYISGQGFAKTSMLTVLIGAALNIVLDPIFIYGLEMGCKGAALATICSQTVSAAWIFAFFLGKQTILRFRRQFLRLDFRVLTPVILLGLSPFFVQVTDCIVPLVMNAGMQHYGNDYYVGTMTVLFSIEQLLRLPVDGLCQGAVPIMSYNYGAGIPERVKGTYTRILACSFGFTSVISWLIMLFPAAFIAPFTDSARIMDIAVPAIRIYFGGMMFIGILYACQRTFMALGRTKLSLLGAMMRKLVILLPLCFILPRLGFGTDGLLYAELIADVAGTAIVFGIFLFNFTSMLKPR